MGKFSLAGPMVATILARGSLRASSSGDPFIATISLKLVDRDLLETLSLFNLYILQNEILFGNRDFEQILCRRPIEVPMCCVEADAGTEHSVLFITIAVRTTQ